MKAFYAMVRMATVGVLMAIAGSAAAQQNYPNKPVHFITPFPPGGSLDPLTRMVAGKLAEKWGQPTIVETRPGGNSIIGTEAVAKSAPDGYTFLVAGNPHVITPLLMHTPYDAIKDFAGVGTIAKSRHVLVLNPSVPANTLQELIALAKARPGQLNYSSSGSGNTNHLAAELMCMLAGIKMQHIPYKGAGPAITDLLGGQVELSFQVSISVIPFIKSGRLRAIAISGTTRSSALPQVPTMAEAGLPEYELQGWTGVFAPAGTPKAIIDKTSSEIARMLVSPEISQKLVNQGLEPFISTAEQMDALMKTDMAKFAKIIKAANIKM
ncbi:MAG: tripartite tricarboxylate transporter substrate binding protein [Pseudomonadota bacterium]